MRTKIVLLSIAVIFGIATFVQAQEAPPPKQVLFTNVKIFNGVDNKLIEEDVLVESNLIKQIGKSIKADANATVIDGGGRTLMQKTVTVGFGHLFNSRSDVIGLGLNWGDPNNKALREQYTTELFYKYQLAQNIAITPSVQWIRDPALNPKEDDI